MPRQPRTTPVANGRAGGAPARSHSASDRDAGLWLIGRINRWMISGAIAISGLLSFVAAHAFHGHTSTAGSAAASSSAAGGGSSGSSGSGASSGSGGSLQQPSQAPAPATAAPSPPVVSGGS
jgi:hypothetical protein